MPPAGLLRVLYQDEHLVAVSKPSGLLVHRSRESADRVFLLQELSRQVDRILYPVHRLDRAASGVIVFGSTSADARWLQAALADEAAVKEYLVLVRGTPAAEGSSERPLTDDQGVRREARTTFTCVEELGRFTLLRVRIHTGRRHQIRRHLAHLAHQVVGDTTYGKGRINQELRDRHALRRLFLHATRLVLQHGPKGSRLEIVDPLPQELERVLAGLRAEA